MWSIWVGKLPSLSTDSEATDRRPLDELERLFASWPRHPDECLQALGDAGSWVRDGASMPLGSAVLALLKNFDRLAEACEILDLMADASRAMRRFTGSSPADVEQLSVSIRQQWGETVALPEPVVVPEATQLMLEFGGPGTV